MIATPNTPDRSDPLARSLLDIAALVEADESRIKVALLAAARAGDCARVIAIVERWQHMPSSEVLGPTVEPRRIPALSGGGE